MSIHSNQITFIDLTDTRALKVNLRMNLPNSQIHDVNKNSYIPSWEYSNMIITPDVYLDAVLLPLSQSSLSIEWSRRDGIEESVALSQDVGEYVMQNRIQITKNILSTSASGMITYTCTVRYAGLSAQAAVTVCRIDTGKNATGATTEILNRAELNYATPSLTLSKNISRYQYVDIFYHDASLCYGSQRVLSNYRSDVAISLSQHHIENNKIFGYCAKLQLSNNTASLPAESNYKFALNGDEIYVSDASLSYIVVDSIRGII